MSASFESPLDAALLYAQAGCAVFPLHTIVKGKCTCGRPGCDSPGKHPRTQNGVSEASTDAATIRRWWERWPTANIGMRMDGLVAVDVDPRNGGEATFDDLNAKHGGLPDTWTQRSGSGGAHYVFKARPGVQYNGKAGPGVDLKHGNAYLVVEPSNHVSGGVYSWLDETGPLDGSPLAEAPAWLGAQPTAGKPAEKARATDLLDELLSGANLHDAALRLIAKWVAQGMDDATIRATMAALAEQAKPVRGGARVAALLGVELDRMIAGARRKFERKEECEPRESPFQPLDLAAMARRDPAPPQFVIQDWLPCGEVSLLAGHGGGGKSAIALMLAVCVASGKPFYGLQVQRRKVAFVSLEDSENVLHWRLSRVCAWLGVDLASLADWLVILDASSAEAALIRDTREGAELTPAYDDLAQLAAGFGGLVIDGASDAFDANENERRSVRKFIRSLRKLIQTDGFVLLLAHVDKLTAKGFATSQGYSGSTAWSNSVRARWFLQPETEDDGSDLLLTVQKANHAKAGAQLRLQWNDSAHVFVGALSMPASKIERDMVESDTRAAVLALISRAAGSGNPVPAAAAGPRTAWHVLAAMPGFPDSLKGKGGQANVRAIIERLRAAGAIVLGTETYGKRNSRAILVPASVEGAGNARE